MAHMADRFQEVSRQSWGQNIAKSVGGAVFGLVLFFGSFAVLWWNEGRQDMSKVAAETTPIGADQPEASASGQSVSVTAALVTTEKLGDEPYLKAGDDLALYRDTEMFAWVEEKSEETREKVGGGTETVTTYNYVKKWTARPQNSGEFRHPEGHANPQKTVENREQQVSTAKAGVYAVRPRDMELPASRELALSPDRVFTDAGFRLEGNSLFMGSGSPGLPQVGDQRIRYRRVPNNLQVTAFGKLQGEELVPFYYKGKDKLYRAIEGDRESAIVTMRTEHRTMTWILRGVGFFMMWFGMMLFFDPVFALLGFLPILKQMGKFVIGTVAFLVALGLSLVTIIVSMIAHHPIALVVTVALLLGLGIFLLQRKKKKAQVPA